MKDRIFAAMVLIVLLTSSYIISKHQTEEDKIKNFMTLHMK